MTSSTVQRIREIVKHDEPLQPDEIEAKLSLNRSFLRAALAVAGSHSSTPAANKVAGEEVARLKSEICALEALKSQAA